jgi:tape measure domain-containing protein
MGFIDSVVSIGISASASKAERDISKAVRDIKSSLKTLESQDDVFRHINSAIKEGTISAEEHAVAIGKAALRMESMDRAIVKATEATKRYGRYANLSSADRVKAIEKEIDAERRLASERERLRNRAESIRMDNPLYRLKQETKELNQLQKRGLLSGDFAAEQHGRNLERYRKSTTGASKDDGEGDRLKRLAESVRMGDPQYAHRKKIAELNDLRKSGLEEVHYRRRLREINEELNSIVNADAIKKKKNDDEEARREKERLTRSAEAVRMEDARYAHRKKIAELNELRANGLEEVHYRRKLREINEELNSIVNADAIKKKREDDAEKERNKKQREADARRERESLVSRAESIRMQDPRYRLRMETRELNRLQHMGLLSGSYAEAQHGRNVSRYNEETRPATPERRSNALLGGFKTALGGFLGPIAATYAAINAVRSSFQSMFEFDRISAGFETFTKSAEKTREIMRELRSLSEKGISFAISAKSTSTLLQYGTAADQALRMTKQLAIISGGDSDKLDKLSLAFAQVNAAGRLMGQEAIQLVNAGFSPYLEISKKTGESMAQLKKRQMEGGISSNELADALRRATQEGGRFDGMLERLASSSVGRFEKMKTAAQSLGVALARSIPVESGMDSIANILKNATPSNASSGGQPAPLITEPHTRLNPNPLYGFDAMGLKLAGFLGFSGPGDVFHEVLQDVEKAERKKKGLPVIEKSAEELRLEKYGHGSLGERELHKVQLERAARKRKEEQVERVRAGDTLGMSQVEIDEAKSRLDEEQKRKMSGVFTSDAAFKMAVERHNLEAANMPNIQDREDRYLRHFDEQGWGRANAEEKSILLGIQERRRVKQLVGQLDFDKALSSQISSEKGLASVRLFEGTGPTDRDREKSNLLAESRMRAAETLGGDLGKKIRSRAGDGGWDFGSETFGAKGDDLARLQEVFKVEKETYDLKVKELEVERETSNEIKIRAEWRKEWAVEDLTIRDSEMKDSSERGYNLTRRKRRGTAMDISESEKISIRDAKRLENAQNVVALAERKKQDRESILGLNQNQFGQKDTVDRLADLTRLSQMKGEDGNPLLNQEAFQAEKSRLLRSQVRSIESSAPTAVGVGSAQDVQMLAEESSAIAQRQLQIQEEQLAEIRLSKEVQAKLLELFEEQRAMEEVL